MMRMGFSSFLGKGRAKRGTGLQADLLDDKLKFKVIIDNIEDGVIMIDNQQVIQLINPGAAAICGWPPDEATGLSVRAVIQLVNEKGEAYGDGDDPFRRIFASDQNLRVNNTFLLTRDRKQIPISLNLSRLTDQDAQVTAAVAVIRNVSQERAQERQRADFISTASHEMRTPVAAIEGYIALVLNDKVATIDNRARD
jgi:two-component system, OmpR family, sensor histidine kinase VicK